MSAMLRRTHPYIFHSSKKLTYETVRKVHFKKDRSRGAHLRATIAAKKCTLFHLIRSIDDKLQIYQGPLRENECLRDVTFLGLPEFSDDLLIANHIQANTNATLSARKAVWMWLMQVQVLEQCARAIDQFTNTGLCIINPFEERVTEGIKNHFKKLPFLNFLSPLEKYIIINAYITYRREKLIVDVERSPEAFYFGITKPTSSIVEFRDMSYGAREGWTWGGLVREREYRDTVIDGALWRSTRFIETFRPGRKEECLVIFMCNDGHAISWRMDGLVPPCPHCKQYFKDQQSAFPNGLNAKHCGCLDLMFIDFSPI